MYIPARLVSSAPLRRGGLRVHLVLELLDRMYKAGCAPPDSGLLFCNLRIVLHLWYFSVGVASCKHLY